MENFIQLYNTYYSLANSVLEIGSRDGLDAHKIAKYFNIPSENVFLVEPHPTHIQDIKQSFPEYKLFPYAITLEQGIINFDAVINPDPNIRGQSSVLPRHVNHPQSGENWIQVPSITGKILLDEINLPEIDLIKIDVEGLTYEVLESFGEDLNKLKFLHLEVETIEFWNQQKLYPDVVQYLTNKGFEEVYNNKHEWELQFDSFWKRK